ncbi:MAG: lipoate--protein ligase [Chlorobi bacterium]|nr:lipoate--protein ligase [Chlorobiota bacterium]
MIGVFSPVTDTAFNLATEEHLLKNRTEDVLFMYVNDPAIVVGKHQNTLAEIDLDYVKEKKIPVFRRLSGGGTVYHDHGNLNFCFITNEEKGNLVNFDKHTQPVVKALEGLGLQVNIGKRHDLSINGLKITGTASHIYRNRALHHGTLLFSADLTVLNRCLKDSHGKFRSKGVRSVRSAVTNISRHLEKPMTMMEFSEYMFGFLSDYYHDIIRYELSDEEKRTVTSLVNEKFGTWKWNYGYGPRYEIRRNILFEGKTINSDITVEKGLITETILVSDDEKLNRILSVYAGVLKGVRHEKRAVKAIIRSKSGNIKSDVLLSLLF